VVHRCRRYLANSKALGAPINVEQQGHQERWTETQSVASASAEPLNEIFFRIETSGWGPSPTRLLSVRSIRHLGLVIGDDRLPAKRPTSKRPTISTLARGISFRQGNETSELISILERQQTVRQEVNRAAG